MKDISKEKFKSVEAGVQKICEGCLGGAHCIECFYFNPNRRDGSYAYCEKHNSWHRPTDYYCSSFSRK